MNKSVRTVTLLFIVYSIAVIAYMLAHMSPVPVAGALRGTSADPLTFMPAKILKDAVFYARMRDMLSFIGTPFTWLVLFAGLSLGWFSRLHRFINRKIRVKQLAWAAFILAVLMFITLSELPFDAAYYMLSKLAGTSNMSVPFWLTDQLKSFAVSTAITIPIIALIYFIIRRSTDRWWLWISVCMAPILVFMIFIQPVVLDPLFNTFTPLKDSAVKRDILVLADRAHIPAKQVYEVNMGRRTNQINAYVTGIGSNTRIVLWDTTMQKLKPMEIRFIMAHEMGHYVMKHVLWGTGFAIAGFALLSYVIFLGSRSLLRTHGRKWGIPSVQYIASLPLLLLLFSMANFMTSPFESYVSRGMEKAADTYALQLTKDGDAGISAFHALANIGKSEVNPPGFIKWWKYSHPPITDRLERFMANNQ